MIKNATGRNTINPNIILTIIRSQIAGKINDTSFYGAVSGRRSSPIFFIKSKIITHNSINRGDIDNRTISLPGHNRQYRLANDKTTIHLQIYILPPGSGSNIFEKSSPVWSTRIRTIYQSIYPAKRFFYHRYQAVN